MESLDLISKLLNERIMLGKKEDITDHLSLIPVYKVKVNFFNVNTDIKNTTGDGTSGSLAITPICILQILDQDISIIKFEDKSPKEDFFDIIPNMISNVNLNDVLKGLKL